MNKPLIKRSQFVKVDTTTSSMIMVEADEVYVTQVTPSAVPMKVQRQRERDLAAFLTANPSITGGAIQVFGTLDPTYGRVPLDAPLDYDGKLTNKAVTTTAGDLKQADRVNHQSVGMKEMVTFASTVNGSQSAVLIELVHYVPAAEIAA